MSLYVEIMCDVRREGRNPRNILRPLCWSDGGVNPQGRGVAAAKDQAREQGWKLGPHNFAICPGCRQEGEREA